MNYSRGVVYPVNPHRERRRAIGDALAGIPSRFEDDDPRPTTPEIPSLPMATAVRFAGKRPRFRPGLFILGVVIGSLLSRLPGWLL